MYKLELERLGIRLELEDEAYNNLKYKEVEDKETGEFLFRARIIKVSEDVLLVVKETKFKRVEE